MINIRPIKLWLFCTSVLFLGACKQVNQIDEETKETTGSIERIENFESQYVNPRNVDVWLPYNYSKDTKYAVLYMHDGQMLFDSTSTWNKQEWGVDEVMDKLMKDGAIRNTIVVGIWNTELRHSEYFPQKPFESLPVSYRDSILKIDRGNTGSALFKSPVVSDAYLKFIVEELKPFIDANYSTYSNMENTFIAGSSMGGLISMYAICEYPEVFSAAACLSTHWIGVFDTTNNPIPKAFTEYLEQKLPDPKKHKIYFDFGTETLDQYYEVHQLEIDSVMVKKGYNQSSWQSLKFRGANHSEDAWNKRLHIPLRFILGFRAVSRVNLIQ